MNKWYDHKGNNKANEYCMEYLKKKKKEWFLYVTSHWSWYSIFARAFRNQIGHGGIKH